ncbi:MAG: SMC-Scp complex subunit ScpB [Planctomycetales bacterium]|nr:SMC-Scp complex subunit ScpB [Planctomycetales bacterium]
MYHSTSQPFCRPMTSGLISGILPKTWNIGQKTSLAAANRRPYGLFFATNEVNQWSHQSGQWDAAEADSEDPTVRRMRLEAVLLLAKSPLTTRKLAQLAHLADGTEARTLVRRLNQIYDEQGRSIRIEQVAGGFRMLTRAAYAPWLARLGHLPTAVRLSSPMMETLAVVAYRGPVSRADVEAIRGVACGELLRQLMERDLIRISGRSEELGRPYLYDTTKHFLQLFGLPSADALPPINWEPLQEDDEFDTESLDSEPHDPQHST